MSTAERPTTYRGPEGQRGLLTIIADRQKTAGDIFVSAAVLPARLATIGLEAATDVVGARPRIVRKFYDAGKLNRIVGSADKLQAGEHERYTRYVGDKVYSVDFYPKGLSEEAAAAFADSNYEDLTSEDFYHRFNAVRADRGSHSRYIITNYCRSDVTVMIMREDDTIVGTAAIAPIGDSKGSYEFSFGVIRNQQDKGVGSTLLRDMLAVCEAKGIQNVISEISEGNHKSRRAVLGVNKHMDVPWNCKMNKDDGSYSSEFTYKSQSRRVAA